MCVSLHMKLSEIVVLMVSYWVFVFLWSEVSGDSPGFSIIVIISFFFWPPYLYQNPNSQNFGLWIIIALNHSLKCQPWVELNCHYAQTNTLALIHYMTYSIHLHWIALLDLGSLAHFHFCGENWNWKWKPNELTSFKTLKKM